MQVDRQIEVAALTTFDVDPQGKHVRMHMRDRSGSSISLVVPTECLNQLLMSVPRMIKTALRNRGGDDSLCLAHPLESYRIDLAEPDAGGAQQVILTLDTGGGFSVSFSVTTDTLVQLAQSISEDVVPRVAADTVPRCS